MQFSCNICFELSCKENARFSNSIDNNCVKNAVLSYTDNYAIIPSIGPITHGHNLLVSRNHLNTIFGGTFNQTEIYTLLDFASNLMTNNTNDCILCFEHGSFSQECKSLCSTCHAHLHIIPCNMQLSKVIMDDICRKEHTGDLMKMKDICNKYSEYILIYTYGRSYTTSFRVKMAKNLPSQYLRRLVVHHLNSSYWDWKQDLNKNLFNKNIESLPYQFNIPLK